MNADESPQPENGGGFSSRLRLEPEVRVGLGRFRLIRLLGQGGMGSVWLAQDERLGEPVALKFVPSEVAGDSVALDDMRRETLRSRKLTHPNIVRIHDLNEFPGEPPFISMEYVDGQTLSDLRLKDPLRALPWGFLRPIVKQLCEALDYAHGERVIHRDLKPANMMLDSRHRLKLADFGIAAVLSDSISRVSFKHPTSGTLIYMSPQQMDGHTPRATDDIYALGATLYELMASRPPFYTGDIPHQVRNLAPPPVTDRMAELGIAGDVPPDVAALIMACLSKDPEQRPQSARVVAEWIGLSVDSTRSVEHILHSTSREVAPEQEESSEMPPSRPASDGFRPLRWIAGSAAAIGVIGVAVSLLASRSKSGIQTGDVGIRRSEDATFPATTNDGSWDPLSSNLKEWITDKDSQWRNNPDGSITGVGPDAHTYSATIYRHFAFRAEVMSAPGSNGGIFFRSTIDTPYPNGYEAQIYNGGGSRTGGLYRFQNVEESLASDGVWFTVHIVAISNRIIILVNGKVAVDYTDSARTYSQGRLALQSTIPRKTVTYRNLMIKRLSDDESLAWTEVSTVLPSLRRSP